MAIKIFPLISANWRLFTSVFWLATWNLSCGRPAWAPAESVFTHNRYKHELRAVDGWWMELWIRQQYVCSIASLCPTAHDSKLLLSLLIPYMSIVQILSPTLFHGNLLTLATFDYYKSDYTILLSVVSVTFCLFSLTERWCPICPFP